MVGSDAKYLEELLCWKYPLIPSDQISDIGKTMLFPNPLPIELASHRDLTVPLLGRLAKCAAFHAAQRLEEHKRTLTG
jgi:hypothetical protein